MGTSRGIWPEKVLSRESGGYLGDVYWRLLQVKAEGVLRV